MVSVTCLGIGSEWKRRADQIRRETEHLSEEAREGVEDALRRAYLHRWVWPAALAAVAIVGILGFLYAVA